MKKLIFAVAMFSIAMSVHAVTQTGPQTYTVDQYGCCRWTAPKAPKKATVSNRGAGSGQMTPLVQ